MMAKCKHYEVCRLDADENTGEDLCILHSHRPGKDQKAFDEALAAHRKTNGDNFRYFAFPGHTVNFRHATFTKGADFTGAAFGVGTDFSSATFEDVKFISAIFLGTAVFKDATFNEANFSKAKFDQATFLDAKFAEMAAFCNSVFTGPADFTGATFTELADFSNARFEEARFSYATFNERADFNNVTLKEVDFNGARFSGDAFFFRTTFTEEADFFDARFTKQADFRLATFSEKAHFGVARFCGRTFFCGTPNTPIFFGAEVDFRLVTIEPLDALTFRDADLQKCGFLGTDLRKAEITAARWARIGNRDAVYDEIAPLAEGKKRAWSHIERLYRELKQNYEDRRDYERAGDFHYGEKEMRRKNSETALGLRFILTLYWLVSGYGEKYLRPVFWAGVLLAVSTVLYLWLGLCPKGQSSILSLASAWDWLRSGFYSFRAMTLLRPEDLVPIGYAKLVHAIVSLLGPLLFGLFALALRQRLKR